MVFYICLNKIGTTSFILNIDDVFSLTCLASGNNKFVQMNTMCSFEVSILLAHEALGTNAKYWARRVSWYVIPFMFVSCQRCWWKRIVAIRLHQYGWLALVKRTHRRLVTKLVLPLRHKSVSGRRHPQRRPPYTMCRRKLGSKRATNTD